LINKLSDKDKKDWNNFLNSKEKLEVKDKESFKKLKYLIINNFSYIPK